MLASPLSALRSISVDLVDDLSGDCGARVVGIVVAAIVGGIAIDAGEVVDCVDAESGLQKCQICRVEFDFVENRTFDRCNVVTLEFKFFLFLFVVSF